MAKKRNGQRKKAAKKKVERTEEKPMKKRGRPKKTPEPSIFEGVEIKGKERKVDLEEISFRDKTFMTRVGLEQERINELRESIDKVGLLSNVILSQHGGGKFRIIAGFSRLAALKASDAKKVRALVFDDLDKEVARRMCFDENMKREGLSDLEMALNCEKLVDEGKSHDKVGEIMGIKGKKTVQRYLRIARKASDPVKQALHKGKIDKRHAVALCKLDTGVQSDWLDKTIENEWDCRTLEDEIREKRGAVKRENITKDLGKLPEFANILNKKSGGFKLNIAFNEKDELKEYLKELIARL